MIWLRRCFAWGLLYAALILWHDASPVIASTDQEVADVVSALEAQIIAQRLKVERWQASVRATFGGKEGLEESVVGIDTYVDGTRMRKDLHYRYDEGVQPPDPNRLIYEEIKSYSDEFAYEFSSRGKVGRYGTPLVVRNRHDVQQPTIRKFLSYELRAIGNYPNGALCPAYSVDGTLRLIGRTAVTVEDDTLEDGTLCKKVTATYGDIGYFTYWVSIDEGYSIRRHQYDGSKGSRIPGYHERTDITVAEWKDSGIWLPQTTHYERHENDELILSEDAEIEFISVNEPLDKTLFEPISFGIEPGTNAYQYPNPNHQQFVWDGEKVVPRDLRGDTNSNTPQPERSSWSMWLSVNAIIFAVLAALFLLKTKRQTPTL